MQLLLIRHAQSANNALPEEQRVEDPPLTAIGHRQAAALATWLMSIRLDHMVASPFRRSLETAEHIRRQLSLVPQIWIDLHEQGGCYAGYEPHMYQGRPGMSQTQIAAEFPGYRIDPAICEQGWWRCQPYESKEQARARAGRLIERTITEFAGRNVSVGYIVHADFKQLFLEELFASTDAVRTSWDSIYNTAVTAIQFQRGTPRLDTYNSTKHLSPDLVTR
jgi:2,3-bisphosphoglycerate-dependent phosphoglycerate mutase